LEYYDVIDCKIREKKTLLACGEGNGSRTFTLLSNNQPFQIAHVSIVTSNLCQPMVNIEFSSAVKFEIEQVEDDSGIVKLQYELFSSCDGKAPLSKGVWIFQKFIFTGEGINRIETKSFGFNFCECVPCCSGCLEYFVLVKPVRVEIFPDTINLEIKATVSDGAMAALVQEG